MADYYYASERLVCTADSVTRAVRVRRHCFDGSLAPDTYFSVPANTRIAGRYVRGYVCIDPDRDGALVFRAFRGEEG